MKSTDPIPAPQPHERYMLAALQHTRNLYGGTVADHVIARRRAANKAARHSRRVNRRAK